jgi:opacity protein-like surface antigen
MKKILLTAVISAATALAIGQEPVEPAPPTNWKFKAVGGLNGTHASFKNWNAGGQNTLSWIALFDAQANWKKDKLRWDNGLNLAYGQNRILRNPWAKTDDVISLFSKLGYNVYKPLDVALLVDYRSQFDVSRSTDGLNNILSKFMAPGYLTVSLGLDYHPNDKFQIMLSPLTSKMTFVQDFTLSQAGAFGVTPGEVFRNEIGAFAKVLYNSQIMQNVTFKGRLELFSSYNKEQDGKSYFITHTDVNAEALFDFKINKWLSASWSSTIIYDNDIEIQRTNDDGSNLGTPVPLAQIKNILSLGIRYTFVEK